MSYLIAGAALLVLLLFLARLYVSLTPRQLLRTMRMIVGLGLMAIGAMMALAGRLGIGGMAVVLGLTALSTGRLGRLDLGGGSRSSGTTSRVRTRTVEMELDHDTGHMDGQVLGGAFAGRRLGELDDGEVLELYRSVEADGETASLVAAYLDRRLPGWREDFEHDPAAGTGGATDTGAMTEQQAYEILGLAPGASRREIRDAHRRLMMRVHPDQGGSTFLAAKINEAKDRLLGGHR